MKEGVVDMISGGFSGVMVRTITAPLDVLKIRFQLQHHTNIKYNSIFQAFETIVKEEGIKSLWKGNLSATYLWITYSMFQFSIYGGLKRFGTSMKEKMESRGGPIIPTSVVTFLAGTGGGAIAATATYPFDLMRTHFVIQGKEGVHKTMYAFVSHTMRTNGILSLFAGLPASIIGIGIQGGLNFTIYDFLKTTENSIDNPLSSSSPYTAVNHTWNFVVSAISGSIAGGISKLIVFPMDTLKKQMQSDVLNNTFCPEAIKKDCQTHQDRGGIVNCMKRIYHLQGMQGFYKGLSPTIVKAMVTGAISFSSFEVAKKMLSMLKDS